MQKMLPLKARRPHLYGTRKLEAGEEYEAPTEWAIALVAERKADFAKPKKKEAAPAPVKIEETPVEQPSQPAMHESETHDHVIDRLRLEATQVGVDVDRRWGAMRLQHEIDQARRR